MRSHSVVIESIRENSLTPCNPVGTFGKGGTVFLVHLGKCGKLVSQSFKDPLVVGEKSRKLTVKHLAVGAACKVTALRSRLEHFRVTVESCVILSVCAQPVCYPKQLFINGRCIAHLTDYVGKRGEITEHIPFCGEKLVHHVCHHLGFEGICHLLIRDM